MLLLFPLPLCSLLPPLLLLFVVVIFCGLSVSRVFRAPHRGGRAWISGRDKKHRDTITQKERCTESDLFIYLNISPLNFCCLMLPNYPTKGDENRLILCDIIVLLEIRWIWCSIIDRQEDLPCGLDFDQPFLWSHFFFFRSTCDGHGREEPISIKNSGRCYGERFCVPMCRTVRTTGDQGWYLLRNLREISWKSRPCFLSGWMCQSSLLLSRWKYNQTKWSSFLFLKSKRGNWAQLRCSISETLMTLKLWFWKGKGRDRDRLGGREPRASQSHHLHYALLPSLPIIFFAAKMIGHFTITTKRGGREQSTQKNRTEQDRAYARHTTEVGVEQRPKGTVWEREAQSLDAQKRKKNSIKFGFLVFPSKTVEEIPKSSHPISIFSLPNNFWARRWLLSESTTWGLLHCLGFPMFFLLLFQ